MGAVGFELDEGSRAIPGWAFGRPNPQFLRLSRANVTNGIPNDYFKKPEFFARYILTI